MAAIRIEKRVRFSDEVLAADDVIVYTYHKDEYDRSPIRVGEGEEGDQAFGEEEQSEEEGEEGDDDNRCCLWDLVRRRDGAECLPTNDGVDCRPADASNDVQDDRDQGDVVTEAKSRNSHLAQTETRTKDGEVGDGDGAEEVEEEDSET